MFEVARSAGVSIATVSRVVNDSPKVSDHVRARVVAAIAELGYSRDGIARSLRLGKTVTVGAILSDFGNPVVSTIFKAATDALTQEGYLTLVAQSPASLERELGVFNSLLEHRVGGLLWSVSDEEAGPVRSAISGCPVPVVLVERRIEGLPVDSVVADHYTAMVEALNDLVHRGHRSIGIIPGARNQWPRRERLRAFQDVLRNYSPDIVGVVGDFEGLSSTENGEKAAAEILGRTPRPTALVAGGNRVLVGVRRCLASMGLRVPEDVECVASTLADPELARVTALPSAGIEVPADLIGKAAGGLLATRMSAQGTETPESLVIPAVYHPAGVPPQLC